MKMDKAQEAANLLAEKAYLDEIFAVLEVATNIMINDGDRCFDLNVWRKRTVHGIEIPNDGHAGNGIRIVAMRWIENEIEIKVKQIAEL